LRENGCLVTFYNNVKGFITKAELGWEPLILFCSHIYDSRLALAPCQWQKSRPNFRNGRWKYRDGVTGGVIPAIYSARVHGLTDL
jgi:hypothetical protein